MRKHFLYFSLWLFVIMCALTTAVAQENKYKDIIKTEGLKNKNIWLLFQELQI
jgi:hypothetical protein